MAKRGGCLDGYKNLYFYKVRGPPGPPPNPPPRAQNRPPKVGNEVPRPSRTIPESTRIRRMTNRSTKTPPDVQHGNTRKPRFLTRGVAECRSGKGTNIYILVGVDFQGLSGKRWLRERYQRLGPHTITQYARQISEVD